ncbi:MAG: AAA family ATPase [Candidatus Eiseniibacteriota bacterium]
MDELKLLIQSRHAIVAVETEDEERLLALLETVCAALGQPLFTWKVTDGIRRLGAAHPAYETEDPLKALAHIEAAGGPSVYVMCDFAPYLNDARLVRLLRDVAQTAASAHVTLLLAGPSVPLPPEVRHLSARYTLELPGTDEIKQAVLDTFKDMNRGHAFRYQLSKEELDRFAQNLSGLTLPETRRVVSRCILDDEGLDAKDIATALEAKRDRVASSGVLEFEESRGDTVALGGLANLKGWLGRARAGFSERARELGLTPPRGILLVGVQGCGKSLAARSIAREWGLPLLRLDVGRLFDKYVGESEKNLRKALDTAEAVAPVVLWIDEIEKAFAGGSAGSSSDADAGLGKRLFGSFLTWLQDKKPGVFVAATANDLSALPPEMLRKGRFDEIFFVDLPNEAEREEILSLHLTRRRQDPAAFDLPALARASAGYSGAELEQAIVTALYGLIAENGDRLTTERVLKEIVATIPLSRSRAEDIEALRALAEERFVPAR